EEVQSRGEELAAAGTDVARWQVHVDVADGRQLLAEVTEHLRPATALTCKAVERPTHSRVPVVEGLTPRDRGRRARRGPAPRPRHPAPPPGTAATTTRDCGRRAPVAYHRGVSTAEGRRRRAGFAPLGRDLAIDLGTATTQVHVRGLGTVLDEPTLVA